jgi:hypothetical protein
MQDVMNPEPLPTSLRDLENQLAARPCPEQAADFRARVLAAMMSSRNLSIPQSAGRRWWLIWQAAAVILALNLGMSVANGVRFHRLTSLGAAPAGLEFRSARLGAPDGVDPDDRFQAFAAIALAGLNPAADPGALCRNFFSDEEERRWALP